ncbi:hypothetical protein ABEZ87_15510 [Bacillus mycoides]|uniref:hypothetical protein n=1 Tax=Bacillus mycoides TaxID=1405 RepID=UPI003D1D1EBF
MNFWEKRFLKSLLKFSKFVHEYRFEAFSEQEEKVYQKNLEKLRNLFGVEKSPISLDVIHTSVLTAYQRELLQEFEQNASFIKVRYREMVRFIWSNPRCTFSHVEREVICYMLQTLGNSSEEYDRIQQAQKEKLGKEYMEKYSYQALLWELQHVEHELKELDRRYTSLYMQANAGNLRHVVYSLYTERGLSMKEFVNEMDVSESEIHNLIRKGMVTEKLLDMICTYFQIQKTSLWMRYMQ